MNRFVKALTFKIFSQVLIKIFARIKLNLNKRVILFFNKTNIQETLILTTKK